MSDKRSVFNKKSKTYAVRLNSTLTALSALALFLSVALILSVVWLFSGNASDKNIIAVRPDASGLVSSEKVVSTESSGAASSVSSKTAVSSKLPLDPNRFSMPLGESDMRETAYFADAVFVGDSITTGIDLYSALTGTKVIASTGINLETVLTAKSVRNQAGEKVTIPEAVRAAAPSKIYLMLGTNGIDWMSLDAMIEQYEKVLDVLQKDNPKAIFYLQSLPPVTQEKAKKSSGLTLANIKTFNSRLLKLAEKRKMYFVDVYSAIASPDGYLSPQMSTDGVHFKSELYTAWIEYVRRHTSRYE